MFRALWGFAFAALVVTLAGPQMTRAMAVERGEASAIAAARADTTPAALQAPDADDRLAALAHDLMALVDGDSAAPQEAAPPARWVAVDDYVTAVAAVQQPQQVTP